MCLSVICMNPLSNVYSDLGKLVFMDELFH